MSVTRVLKAAGLWTSPSYMSAPLGAFSVADNTVVDSPDQVSSRRGFEHLPYTFGSSIDSAAAMFSFSGTVLVQYSNKLAYDSGIALTDLSGTNSPPDPTVLRMQGVETANNFYYTSTQGVKVLDVPSGTPRLSGVPRGPAPTQRNIPTAVTGNPGTGWFPEDAQTAYVATWARTDDDGTLHEGEPSNAIYIINPPDVSLAIGDVAQVSGTRVDITVPAGYGTLYHIGDVVQLTLDTPDANYPDGFYTVTATTSSTVSYDIPVRAVAPPSTSAGTLSAADKDIAVSVDVPTPFIDETYSVRVYRARVSVAFDVPPRPQYYLTYEKQVDAADVALRSIYFTDSRVDDLLGDPLYTNTDDGEPPDSSLDNDNSQPPYCTDVEIFDQRLWGANYSELQNFALSLLGTGSPNGLQVGDTITIAGIAYTGVSEATVVTTDTFKVFTSSSSPSTNVINTAQSLALAVTKNATSTVDCYYTSGVEDIPGQLLVRGRTPSTSVFTIYASRPSAWEPALTTSSSGALESSADVSTHGLWYSKQNQPEAVPLLNRLPIGPKNCRILRIKTLRDKLFVFTDIAGIWTVSNTYPYSVDRLSKTATLVAPDSLVDFNDSLYCLTSQGVARIDETGPGILSVAIEEDIKRLFGTGLPTLKVKALAVGYESYRKYILAMPTDIEDTYNTQAFVYDVVTKCWTRWTKPIAAMVVVPQTDYLYIASPTVNKVSKERKNYDRTDYADESFAVNIVSADGLEVTLTDASEVSAGDLLFVDPITCGLITDVDTDTNVVTIQDTVSWVAGAATIYTGIETDLTYTPMFSGAPEEWKHYREICYHFRTPGFSLGRAVFHSDVNPEPLEEEFDLGGFGVPAWEDFAWEQPAGPQNKRIPVALEDQRPNYLSIGFRLREAWAQWKLTGYTPVFESGSERGTE